ncbi:NmrA family NAD(P)-binding protein [Dyella sp. 2RAB6]|uniref:NmrA family NAD(P)-binding protein n=1 Tax=Dyella sp. 2RAB6 TaxID=3232992 RepID=UPI003F93957A
MYAITGITGQVGGAVARALLANGAAVRAVVRDAAKGEPWRALGCEVAQAGHEDADALARAFEGADGVFLMMPPDYDPAPRFPLIHALAERFRQAIEQARPGRALFLSTVGAHVAEPNLLNNAGLMEQALGRLSMPVAFLRPAWFMENAAWDLPGAREGSIHSFLQPLDHRIPMVSTEDIGAVAKELLLRGWNGQHVEELEGPQRYGAEDIAQAYASVLGHPVRAEAVPRERWETLFREQGARHPEPRIRMLDGFNEGWIRFEGVPRVAATSLEVALRRIVERSA